MTNNQSKKKEENTFFLLEGRKKELEKKMQDLGYDFVETLM